MAALKIENLVLKHSLLCFLQLFETLHVNWRSLVSHSIIWSASGHLVGENKIILHEITNGKRALKIHIDTFSRYVSELLSQIFCSFL